MFSQIPVDLYKIKKDDLDNVILRAAIMGEMDAINLYEQMAALTDNDDIRKVMLDIAKEEKAPDRIKGGSATTVAQGNTSVALAADTFDLGR